MTEMKKFIVSDEDATKVMNVLEAIGIHYYLPDEEGISNVLVNPTITDGAQEQPIEPENIDKVSTESQLPFVKAQISTKNQMILRNIIAVISGIGVIITFILEKLGII